MRRYKKGDNIRCIASYNGNLTRGWEYKIYAITTTTDPLDAITTVMYRVLNDKGEYSEYGSDWFETPKGGTMNYLKEYFEKHQDSLITIAIVVLVDYYVFNGAFKEKLRALIDKLLNSTSEKLLPKEVKSDAA